MVFYFVMKLKRSEDARVSPLSEMRQGNLFLTTCVFLLPEGKGNTYF